MREEVGRAYLISSETHYPALPVSKTSKKHLIYFVFWGQGND